MKRGNLILAISALSIILISVLPLFSMSSTQPHAMQVKVINDIYTRLPNLPISSLFPYDHGVIVTFYYASIRYFPNGTAESARSVFCVYFVNTTTVLPLYRNILNSNTTKLNGNAFVSNGELHILVNMRSIRTGKAIGSELFVYQGLKLIAEYNYSNINANPFYYNKLTIKKVNNTCIVELPDANITLVNSEVFYTQLFSKDVLIAFVKQENVFPKTRAVPVNFTLYTPNGTIVWTKKYVLSIPLYLYAISPPPDFSGPLNMKFYSILFLGDELFIVNITTPLSSSSLEMLGNVTVNETIVGLNLKNGTVTTEIHLNDIPAFGSLFEVGGYLYVILLNQHNVTVEKYNGTALVKVVTEPIIMKKANGTYHMMTYFDEVLGEFLLILNPEGNRTAVTDVYMGGVISYTLNETVQRWYYPRHTLLLYEGSNYTLVFLNNNGTVRGSLGIGNISFFLLSPIVRDYMTNSSVYYVAAESPYNNTAKVVVYEVIFPTPETTASTNNTTTIATTTTTTSSTTITSRTASTTTVTSQLTTTTSVPVTTSSVIMPTSMPTSTLTTSPSSNVLIIAVIVIVAVTVIAILFLRLK